MAQHALDRRLSEEIARLCSVDSLLIALDFDGTLAPLVDDPAAAVALPESARAVHELVTLPRTRVALVSGRDLASLSDRFPAPDSVLIIASHGGEYRLDGNTAPEPTNEDLRRVAVLQEGLESLAAGVSGIRIEAKPAGAAVHTRLVDSDTAREIHARARDWVAHHDPRLVERTGKDILEFSVLGAHKGEGIERLRAYTGADAVFYAGDDVTDEDAFAALRPADLGVKCGPGPTRAAQRVSDPAEMASVLRALVDFRKRAIYVSTSTAEVLDSIHAPE